MKNEKIDIKKIIGEDCKLIDFCENINVSSNSIENIHYILICEDDKIYVKNKSNLFEKNEETSLDEFVKKFNFYNMNVFYFTIDEKFSIERFKIFISKLKDANYKFQYYETNGEDTYHLIGVQSIELTKEQVFKIFKKNKLSENHFESMYSKAKKWEIAMNLRHKNDASLNKQKDKYFLVYADGKEYLGTSIKRL